MVLNGLLRSTELGDEMKPHKHAELIKAWANGAKIQYYDTIDNVWRDIDMDEHLWYETAEYRIKPAEKKPVVRWLWAYKYPKERNEKDWAISSVFMTEEVAMKHAAQEVKRLDWSRTEFEE